MCVVIAFPSGFPSWFFGGPGCCISTSGECRITLTSRGRPFTSVANMQTHSEASHTDIAEYLTFASCDFMVKF